MKSIVLATALTAAFVSVSATPSVSDVTMTQANNKLVTITYKLDAPAIVTFDIVTNEVSIGTVNLTNAVGDVNRLVDKIGETCSIKWQPKYVWPDRVAKNAKAVVTAWSLSSPPDYMVASMISVSNVAFYVDAEAVPGGVTSAVYKTDKLVMRRIHAAGIRFRMGSRLDESGRSAGYEVPHDVTFTNDYYIGVYPLTQMQLFRVQGAKPSRFAACDNWEMRPAEKFSYAHMRGSKAENRWSSLNPSHEVDMSDGYYLQAFRRYTGLMLDLPTEAQWEVACRAGTDGAYNDGAGGMDAVGWNSSNWSRDPNCRSNETHVVGQLKPNNWGLYDMHGNVGEMCLDWFSKGSYFSDGSEAVEPPGSDQSRESGDGVNYRVIRGGNWNKAASDARSSSKGFQSFWSTSGTTGARLCCPVQFPY
jgi:formylglycine-generating enzyme required for sulfatase activity